MVSNPIRWGVPGRGLIALSVIAAVAAAGCETTGGTLGSMGLSAMPSWVPGGGAGGTATTETATRSESNLTPAERKMREQSKAFQRTVWEGVLIGAGTGAVISALTHHDTKDILKGAAIGGAVGGLAGAYLAHKQEQYSNKEDQLDSMIADVRDSNRDTQALIASARQVVDEDKRRLAAVQKRYKAGKATEAELTGVKGRVADNQKVIAQAAKGARERETMFQGAEKDYRNRNPGTNTAPLQQQLKAYNQNIETLDGLANAISVA